MVDSGKHPGDLKEYFKVVNGEQLIRNLGSIALQFRDDGDWFPMQQIQGNQIEELQTFLHEKGFLPHNKPNGIYDYVTLAAVRLFQEYVRTVEGDTTIGKPDGWAGTNSTTKTSNTWKAIKRWQKDNVVNEWAGFSKDNPTKEYTKWINLLNANKQKYLANLNDILMKVETYSKASDTRKVSEWDFSSDHVHLLGIRRKQDIGDFADRKRANDDIFVLLINGMVFKFWGSTDPNANLALQDDIENEAFLVEGQHEYGFNWHKWGNAKKVYKALRPATKGVLVFRDFIDDDALKDEDIAKGLRGPVNDINIHWSGIGSFNFSAGCQVIAGQSYINHRDKPISCKQFAATSYGGLSNGLTKGAYNVCADLILALTPVGTNTVLYTLGREENLDLDSSLGRDYAGNTWIRLKNA